MLLALAAGIVFSKHITVGGVRWKDESTHTMDGVLLLDWMRAGPAAWRSPVDFAAQQYAHFPNLGLLGVFPPGLALVEAPCFAVFGVSLVSARMVVVLFGIAAAVGCYLLARRWCSRWTAVLATTALIVMPMTVTWTRQAMLEMPTLAVLVWLLYAACRYVEAPSWPRLLAIVVLASAAPLFKQNGVCAIPVLAVVAPYLWWRGRVPLKQLLAGAGLTAAALGTYYALTMHVQGQSQILDRVFNADTPLGEWLSFAELSAYARSVPAQAGYAVAALAALGAVLTLRARDWRWTMVALCFVSAYGLATVMQHKEPRYFFLGYLPIALWAGLGGATLLSALPAGRLRAIGGTIAVLLALGSGYRTPIDYRPDFMPLVGTYADAMRDRIVLVEADRDTCFVLAARSVLGPRGCMVVRGSKLLYSSSCNIDWDFASYVSRREDVSELIEHFAFDLIFVERGNPNQLREVELLHEELADRQRYELLGSHELGVPRPCNAPPIVMDVYRLRNQPPRLAREIEIPVPLARRTVRVTLGQTRSQ